MLVPIQISINMAARNQQKHLFSHTECIFVCHTTMQQHFIDNSVNITELELTKKAKKLPEKHVDTLPE